jgi:D-glycero-D-manno-heptose 1,7-bisphosphate phosphatase
MELRRGAFFDRDGVINASPPPGDYVRRREEFRLLPEAVGLIREFNALDVPVIVVTNQRGVSRGLIDPAELESIHETMRAAVAAGGGRIDDVFCCPHEENACHCRKPLPGLVWRAAEKWHLDVPRSVMVGDSWRDRQLAVNCGMRFVEVREGCLLGEEAYAASDLHARCS